MCVVCYVSFLPLPHSNREWYNIDEQESEQNWFKIKNEFAIPGL